MTSALRASGNISTKATAVSADANTQARLSPTRRESRLCPHRTVCGNLSRHTGRSLAPHAILLQARLSADTRLSHLRHFHHCWWHAARCKWQRMRTCAATAWHRSRPTNPRRHRCDCRAIRPTTGVAAPSGSMYRSAPAVKAHERAWAAMSRA